MVNEQEDYSVPELDTKYDSSILNDEELTNTEIKINPDFYVHMALLLAQRALIKENLRDGLVQYRIIIEHIEVLLKAANKLTETYKADLEAYKTGGEYKEIKDETMQSALLANKKLELLMREIFSYKPAYAALKL